MTEEISETVVIPSFPEIVARYLAVHPGEHEKLARLRALIDETTDPALLTSRQNFTGHITASGFVVSPTQGAVLLVYHKALQLFVQPGGHMEPGESDPIAAARREIREETGLTRLTYRPRFDDSVIPIDIDSHSIRANEAKGEPAHWHHDFRFLFVADDTEPVTLNVAEVTRAHWAGLDKMHMLPTMEAVSVKLRDAMNYTGPASAPISVAEVE